MASFGSADSVDVRHANNNGVDQFKPIFPVEGNTFRPIVFGYFITDWLLYNFGAGSFHTTKLCSKRYSIKIEYHSEKSILSRPLGT